MNTAVFMDIDGVLNPWGDDDQARTHYSDFELVSQVDSDLRENQVWVSKALGEAIYDWPIVWATTWCLYPEQLAQYTVPYNLVGSPSVDSSLFDNHLVLVGYSLKKTAVQRYIEENADELEVAIWIDDDLSDEDRMWFQSFCYDNEIDGHCITPDCDTGLDRPEVLKVNQILGL